MANSLANLAARAVEGRSVVPLKYRPNEAKQLQTSAGTRSLEATQSVLSIPGCAALLLQVLELFLPLLLPCQDSLPLLNSCVYCQFVL